MKFLKASLVTVLVTGAIAKKDCTSPQEIGRCRGAFERWHYNQETNLCETFIYGGCGGNGNNYMSEKACTKRCIRESSNNSDEDTFNIRDVILKQAGQLQDSDNSRNCEAPISTGRCRGFNRRYGYDSNTKECREFIYGGCQDNGNNYQTMEACNAKCVIKPRDCNAPFQQVLGPCRAFIPRFGYNKATGRCERIVFGGCRDNGNSFSSLSDCEAECL